MFAVRAVTKNFCAVTENLMIPRSQVTLNKIRRFFNVSWHNDIPPYGIINLRKKGDPKWVGDFQTTGEEIRKLPTRDQVKYAICVRSYPEDKTGKIVALFPGFEESSPEAIKGHLKRIQRYLEGYAIPVKSISLKNP